MNLSDLTLPLLVATPGWQRLCSLRPDLDDETAAAIITEAARVADRHVAPLNARGDHEGCQLRDGRVSTPEGYAAAYGALAQDGWLAMDLPESLGGQGLPLTLHAAASIPFERACMALMMAAGASRAAAHMLSEVAPDVAAEWVPKLASGEWTATICISEPDAGSDVGRIRTRARQEGDHWRIDGAKIWISFGDHDMADRIGHCLLARTGDSAEGTRGLSLFLVPDRLDDGQRNGITVTRLEDKMGLHGSPTCAMSFDGARATLLGEEGRGLQQMFAMIEMMRLQTACQGLGIAVAACDIARAYAGERRQGGHPAQPAVPIIDHADVRRQLAAIETQTALLQALVIELAATLDLARLCPEEDHATLAAFLLPLAKNFGGEIAFDAASGAMQVLGGAGYTREWPVEQLLRDSRVITIYEGTTGMQAQDFLIRRLVRGNGAGLAAFLSRARPEVATLADPEHRATAEDALRRFENLSARLLKGAPEDLAPAATGYLRAGWCAVSAWLACRLPPGLRSFALHDLSARSALAEAQCRPPASI